MLSDTMTMAAGGLDVPVCHPAPLPRPSWSCCIEPSSKACSKLTAETWTSSTLRGPATLTATSRAGRIRQCLPSVFPDAHPALRVSFAWSRGDPRHHGHDAPASPPCAKLLMGLYQPQPDATPVMPPRYARGPITLRRAFRLPRKPHISSTGTFRITSADHPLAETRSSLPCAKGHLTTSTPARSLSTRRGDFKCASTRDVLRGRPGAAISAVRCCC